MSVTVRTKLTQLTSRELVIRALQRRGRDFQLQGDMITCRLAPRPRDNYYYYLRLDLSTMTASYDGDRPLDKAILRAYNAEQIIQQAEQFGLVWQEKIDDAGIDIGVEIPDNLELATW